MLLDELELISKIQKNLKESYQSIGDAMISGGVDNMEKYKYLLGQAHAYYKISQDISNLLKKKSQMEDKIKKTSSDSTQLKIKLALEEKYKEENKKEVDGYERLKTKESAKLPKPTGWRILVLPFKMPERTKGGLFLGQDTLERQQIASTCGLVLSMGAHCYDKDRYPEGPWCKKGDWVIFRNILV